MKASLLTKRNKIYVCITYNDEYGNIKKKWFGTGLDDNRANRKKANELKEERLEEFRKNYQYMERKESQMLFGDFLTQWLERARPNLQVSTYSTYKMQVDKIATYFNERNIKLLDLKPLDIANFYSNLQKSGKTVQLCEHYHVNIRRALQTALKAGIIPFNPADRIDRPKSPKHIASYYNKKQLEQLFEILDESEDSYGYIFKITAYYGLRRSEVLGIKWKNIDFENNVIILNHTVVQTRLNGKSIIVAKDRMKNQSSLRSLPLLSNIKELLLKEKEKQEKNKKLYGESYENKYSEYLCVDDLGYRINPDTLSSHFQLVLQKNDLPRIKFHELRHSCASLLLEAGVNMKEIQEWLGHSTYNTTADIYSHLDFSSKRNVANILTNTFVDEEIQSAFEGRTEIFDNPKPRRINKYKHRENTKTIDMQMEQTVPNLDDEIAELDKLIKMKEELLRKKKLQDQM